MMPAGGVSMSTRYENLSADSTGTSVIQQIGHVPATVERDWGCIGHANDCACRETSCAYAPDFNPLDASGVVDTNQRAAAAATPSSRLSANLRPRCIMGVPLIPTLVGPFVPVSISRYPDGSRRGSGVRSAGGDSN